MTNNTDNEHPFTQYHKDGSLWAKGEVIGNVPTGYWEWFRKDGTRMRSGYFRDGIPVGEWTTYDASGAPYKMTDKKAGKPGERTTVERR